MPRILAGADGFGITPFRATVAPGPEELTLTVVVVAPELLRTTDPGIEQVGKFTGLSGTPISVQLRLTVPVNPLLGSIVRIEEPDKPG